MTKQDIVTEVSRNADLKLNQDQINEESVMQLATGGTVSV